MLLVVLLLLLLLLLRSLALFSPVDFSVDDVVESSLCSVVVDVVVVEFLERSRNLG